MNIEVHPCTSEHVLFLSVKMNIEVHPCTSEHVLFLSIKIPDSTKRRQVCNLFYFMIFFTDQILPLSVLTIRIDPY